MTNTGGAAGGSGGDPEPPSEELLHFAKQRKRDANARHRARKKAVQADPDSWQQDMERQLEAERRRLAELQCDAAALNGMAAYQHEAMRVLEFANFAERMGGEVTLLGADAAAAAVAGGLGDDVAATAAAAEAAKDGKDWVALFAANLALTEKVEASVGSAGSVGERHAGTARAAQQAAAWQAAAAAECADAEEAGANVSSRCGSGGSRGSGSGGPTSSDTAAGAAAADAAAVPVSPVALSTAGDGAAGRGAQRTAAAAVSRGAHAAAGAAARSGGAATASSVRAHSPGQQAPAGANEFLERMNLGASDRGLMDLLMQEQRVIKHWYFAGSATVRASIVRLAAMAMSVLPASVILQRNKAYMRQLQHTVQRWEAFPGSRQQIEEILAARFMDRQVLMRHLAHNNPKALLEVWAGVTCPPAPPGAPSIGGRPPLHPMLLPIAQYLDSILTPHKLAQLQVDWRKYQQAMGAAIEMRVQASARLQYAAAVQAVSWQKQSMLPSGGSSAERSQAYCTMADSTGCLTTLETRELIALLDLQEALIRVLTPIQMARVFVGCYPYNPDMTRICPWLLTKPAASPQQQPPLVSLAEGHFLAPMPAQPTYGMLGLQFGPAAPPCGAPQAVVHHAAPSGGYDLPGGHAPAGSHVQGVLPVGAADVAGAGMWGAAGLSGAAGADLSEAAFAPADLAGEALGSDPADPDALLDLLNDEELDLLIADLGGEDVGHLLAATSPRLP